MSDLVELVMKDHRTITRKDTEETIPALLIGKPQLIITTEENRHPKIDSAKISSFRPDSANAFLLGENHIRQVPIPDPFHVSDKQRYGYVLYQSIQWYKV